MESPSNGALKSDSEADLINRDAHRQFMETANQLIETTRTKLNYMQGLSEDLSEMASLIKDERKEKNKAGKHNFKYNRINKDTKNNYDIVIPIASNRETPTPELHQNQSPRNRKNKKITKEKDKRTGKNAKNDEDLNSKVTSEKDTTSKKGTVIDKSSATTHGSSEKKTAKGITTHAHIKHKKGKKTTRLSKIPGEHKKQRNDQKHFDLEKTKKQTNDHDKGHTLSEKKQHRPKPKRHCCAQHSRVFTGPVLFADSHEQFRHIQLPSLLRTATLMSLRMTSDMNDKKHFNKQHSDFRKISTSAAINQDDDLGLSCEDDVVKSTKNGCNRFRNNCLQDFNRKNVDHHGKRDVLTPNKVTIQSTGFTKMLTEASFLPVDEISFKFRFRFGQHKPIFPLNLNLHKYFGDKTR